MSKAPNHTPLEMIITRVGMSALSKGAYFDAREVRQWQKNQLELLQEKALLEELSTLKEVIECTGCEQLCQMKVTIDKDANNNIYAYITCTDDSGGHIEVNIKNLKQWYSSIKNFAAVLPEQLQTIMAPDVPINEDGKWPLGLVKSRNGHVPITLTIMQGHGLILLIGDQKIPLKQVLSLRKNGLLANNSLIRNMANMSSQKETPEARRERLQNQINTYKAQNRKDFFVQTAKDEGISSQRLRAILNPKNENVTLDSVWHNVALHKK